MQKNTSRLAKVVKASLGLAACFASTVSAYAIVTFDPTCSLTVAGWGPCGFVGKGDVQLVYNWNNKQLQDNAALVNFRINEGTTTSWTCTRSWVTGPEQNPTEHEVVQVRHTTTVLTGLIDEIARENSKGKDGPVTGFKLISTAGVSVINDGPEIGSCPAAPSEFVYDENAVTESTGTGLQVSTDGTNWYPIPAPVTP
jgi:hypothetical protein